jgi:hypothetical protein
MDMPVWLRVFYIKEINKVIEARNKQQEKQQRKSPRVDRPGIRPPKPS